VDRTHVSGIIGRVLTPLSGIACGLMGGWQAKPSSSGPDEGAPAPDAASTTDYRGRIIYRTANGSFCINDESERYIDLTAAKAAVDAC
jgi:hypothetical protein